jgi:hypothetical protein
MADPFVREPLKPVATSRLGELTAAAMGVVPAGRPADAPPLGGKPPLEPPDPADEEAFKAWLIGHGLPLPQQGQPMPAVEFVRELAAAPESPALPSEASLQSTVQAEVLGIPAADPLDGLFGKPYAAPSPDQSDSLDMLVTGSLAAMPRVAGWIPWKWPCDREYLEGLVKDLGSDDLDKRAAAKKGIRNWVLLCWHILEKPLTDAAKGPPSALKTDAEEMIEYAKRLPCVLVWDAMWKVIDEIRLLDAAEAVVPGPLRIAGPERLIKVRDMAKWLQDLKHATCLDVEERALLMGIELRINQMLATGDILGAVNRRLLGALFNELEAGRKKQ